MYCKNCGNQLAEEAIVCPSCGVATENFYKSKHVVSQGEDKASFGMKLLCFFFPIVGLILYFTNKNEYPDKAKSYGTYGLIGFMVNVFLILMFPEYFI